MIKGVELRDVFMTLQAYLGSLYVNDFNRFGRTWQVIVQAEPKYRDQKDDINRLQVRNQQRDDGPPGRRGQGRRDQRAAGAHPLQHVPRRVDQRQRVPGRQLGHAPSRRWRSWPTASCPRR